MNTLNSKLTFLAILLIAFALVSRLLPHPPNFAPIAAVAIFGAFYLPKRWAILAPIGALFLSDLLIGFYNPRMMVVVYGSFACIGVIGLVARRRKNFYTILGTTLIGSVIFFLATNTAVWAFGSMYSNDLSGLFQSYKMAIPFFRNTIAGDLFYVGVLVGTTECALHYDYIKSCIRPKPRLQSYIDS